MRAFETLLAKFAPMFDSLSPYNDSDGAYQIKTRPNFGRSRLIDARDGLGLVLGWTRTRGSQMVLQMIFGMTQSCTSLYIQFGSRILTHVLQQIDEARVRVPSIQYVAEMIDLVQKRHPALEKVLCTMDGVKLLLECSSSDDEQNNYHNGWQCDHFVNAVFVFCPDGTIRVCCYNVPGSQHDSTIAEVGGIYKKLGDIFSARGGRCTVDSAFARMNHPFLIKSGKDSVELNRTERQLLKEATSMRQSAEWGMRAFQSSFPRIKDRIKWEVFGKRRHMLKMLVLLFNFRTNMVGINQILSVYKGHLDRDTNEDYMNRMEMHEE